MRNPKIVKLRPHHLPLLLDYLEGNLREHNYQKNGDKFFERLNSFFLDLSHPASDIGQISIVGGLDSICNICAIQTEGCKEQDSLEPLFKGSSIIMQRMELEIGKTYSHEDFLRRLNSLYKKDYCQLTST